MSNPDKDHSTADEIAFINRLYKRKGIEVVKKYADTIPLRVRWDRIDKTEIQRHVALLLSLNQEGERHEPV